MRDRRSITQAGIVASLTWVVASCGGSQHRELLPTASFVSQPAAAAASHGIFVATTRNRSANSREIFDSTRAEGLSFARVDVSIPKSHKIATIERDGSGLAGDPSKHFAVNSVSRFGDSSEFAAALASATAARDGRAMVFVHGYNTGFDDAVYRMAQIAHDTGYPGTPLLFSWASGGKTADYIYDKESASAARDDLEQVLTTLANSKVRSIDIVAHSMGTWIAMEALRQLAIVRNGDLQGKLGFVILASPDIDVDVFKRQMRRYGKPKTAFAVLLSGDDKALKLSSLIAGDKPRVGDYANAADLADFGVEVVDLSRVRSGNRLNHAKFADNPLIVKLMGERLRLPPNFRPNPKLANQRVRQIADALGISVEEAAGIIVTTPGGVVRISGR